MTKEIDDALDFLDGYNVDMRINGETFSVALNEMLPEEFVVTIRKALEQAKQHAAIMAEVEKLINIVEGVGVVKHGCWRNDKGMRLKDTVEWVELYIKAREIAEIKEGE